MTGYAQVYGKYNTDPYEKLEFDLLYINDMNVFTDLKLLFATFGILFKKESTEGVEAGQVTAIGEQYTMPGFEQTVSAIDYDSEKLQEEEEKELAAQWAD